MKFPSVQTLVHATVSVCKRFPLTVVFTLLGCYYAILYTHHPYEYDDKRYHYYYNNIIWSTYLGMLLSLALTVYVERKKLSTGIKWLCGLLTICAVIAFYFSLPDYFSEGRFKQFLLFVIGLHLLLAFIPYTAKGEINGFWQYNKILFLRILAAALYSCVLYTGLSLAILAVDKLFSVDINYKWYADLWIILVGGFNTVFFLAGFPSAYETLETKTDYPKGLKIFTQYVLLPIITVYLLILYAYMFKIIGTRQWPYGWVSYLVLAFAITGILSLLLIHPIKYETNNKWIPAFNRFYYIAICPLIVLLFLAIEKRINAYGITEDRYIVLVLSLWLAVMALYFIFSKIKNIKIIPASLSLIAFLISFGPWGLFSVSYKSQTNRLLLLLRANHMLADNQKIIPANGTLKKGEGGQIGSIVEYLISSHNYQSLQPLFSINLDSLMKNDADRNILYDYMRAEKLLAYMNVNKYDRYGDEVPVKAAIDSVETQTNFRIGVKKTGSLNRLRGYEYAINDYKVDDDSNKDSAVTHYQADGLSVQLNFSSHSGTLSLTSGKDSVIYFDLNALVKKLTKNNFQSIHSILEVSPDSLTFSSENKELGVRCEINDIFVNTINDSIHISRVYANLFLHFKSAKPVSK